MLPPLAGAVHFLGTFNRYETSVTYFYLGWKVCPREWDGGITYESYESSTHAVGQHLANNDGQHDIVTASYRTGHVGPQHTENKSLEGGKLSRRVWLIMASSGPPLKASTAEL